MYYENFILNSLLVIYFFLHIFPTYLLNVMNVLKYYGYITILQSVNRRRYFVKLQISFYFLNPIHDIYRITTILKVETDIIPNISASLIAGIFVIMSVEAFSTGVILFINDVIMCFMSDWPIDLHMRVTNWPDIFVDQGRFSDPDFIRRHTSQGNCQICQ
jgi:hypothetical protein